MSTMQVGMVMDAVLGLYYEQRFAEIMDQLSDYYWNQNMTSRLLESTTRMP